ncbi:MAG: sodium:proton antiporter [Alphaproteobacteria bacterium]|nr:sodium:proton antiporter [Alphaproteobacteria bacterium]
MIELVLSILAITVLLLLASLLLPVAARLRVPHTVLLAALGIALGVLASQLGEGGGNLGIASDVIRGLGTLGFTAESFLYLFLPPLLFTAGLGIDVRRLFDEFAAVLLMAVVAVLVTIAVVGLAMHWISGVDAIACFLLGAIVSTTDPAAVIGIFRDIGAPKRLTILVEGESLLNDAAAIAVFTILVAMLSGTAGDASAGGALLTFLKEFLGGLVLGFVLGRIACAILALFYNSELGHVSVTVALAYLAFVIGTYYLHVSGVVAVVAAALTLAAYGPTRVTPGAWRRIVETWHQLDFWANSLIFVLAAMLAVGLLADLHWRDVGLLAVLIVAAMAARGLVLFGLLPGLSALKLVAPVETGYKAVMLWGGLRGAVTVVLALVAVQSQGVSEELRHFLGVLATLFVLFTLFVCGPTLRPLMRLFGLDRLSPIDRALRDRVMALSHSSVGENVKAVARNYGLENLWDQIAPAAAPPLATDDSNSIGEDDAVRVGLITLANREKELYLDHFEQRVVSRRMVSRLVATAERLADLAKADGERGYADGARRSGAMRLGLRLALALSQRFNIARPLSIRLADHCEALLTTQLVLTELVTFNRAQLRPLFGPQVGERLLAQLALRQQQVQRALDALSLQYAGYTEIMQRKYLMRAALRFEGAEYDRQLAESMISREVFNDLQRDLGHRRRTAEQRPPLDLGMELRAMIASVPLFTNLDSAGVTQLAGMLRPRLAVPGETIVVKGGRGTAMYFIAAGAVDVVLRGGMVRLESGNFFGEIALLSDQRRNADVVAVGYCHLLVLQRSDFRRLLRARPHLRAEIERVAAARLAEDVPQASQADPVSGG